MVSAELQCMEDLLRLSEEWKYYINLTGEELPLVTNLELVNVLSKLRGTNALQSGISFLHIDCLGTRFNSLYIVMI